VPIDKLKWSNEPVRSTTSSAAPSNNAKCTGTTGEANRASASERSASEKWYPDHAVFNATKDQLKAMPQFKYD